MDAAALLQTTRAVLRVTLPQALSTPSAPTKPPEPHTDLPAGSSVQEVWWALEDLWLRLWALGLLRVERDRAGTAIVLAGLRRPGIEGELRSAALDAQTYQAWQGGRWWPFVRTLEYRGDDLVCELTPAEVIAGWPDGDDLAWQVRGLLARLEAMEPRRARR